ncbi:MAG: Bug family tripartite tricarboxylate transporter substrate binding protein [Gammaproteobacteria bacterium]
MISRRLFAAGTVLGALSVTAGLPVYADSYPDRPIKFVVPFTAGGITDNLARVTGQYASKALSQPIIVDNRPGAGGGLAAMAVAQSAADGYTIFLGTQGTQAANFALYKNLRYKEGDFRAVQGLMAVPNVVVVNASTPYKNLAELVAFAKKNPEKLTYSSPGVGTGAHLAAELFQTVAGIKLRHVPYKGSAGSITDLLAGNIDLSFDYPATTVQHIKAGKLRAIAVTGTERTAALSDVPTMSQLGYPSATAESWTGIFVPRNTPDAVVQKLQAAFAQSIEDKGVQEKIVEFGGVPMRKSGKVFEAFAHDEVVKWKHVVEKSGATLD